MDLDEDLLALAAGSGDEEEAYSEPEEEEEEDYYEEAKPSSKKKRKIVEDDEDEDEDEGLKNPYPLEGKFKDEDDRDAIMAMDDLQREAILFERSQVLERFQERKYLELRAKKDKLNEEEKLRSKRKGKSTTKEEKRELLRAQRKKAEKKRRGYQAEADEDEEEEDEDEYDDEYAREADYDEDDYQLEDDNDYGFADLKRDREPEKDTTLSDINNVHIGRQLLAQYFTYPEFPDVVTDCYAKINVGVNNSTGQSGYRMVQIKEIIEVPEKVYTLVNKKTAMYAIVAIGKSSRRVPLNIFSDRPITNEEFGFYRERLEKDNMTLLSIRQISKKYYELREMARRNLTDKEINDIISKREDLESNLATVNVIMKKKLLQQQRQIALENDEFEKADTLDNQIKTLEQDIASNQKTKESVLASVNERNKKLNQELIRKAELRAIEEKLNDQLKDDPFSRLKTRTKMFYKGSGEDKVAKMLDETKDEMLERLEKEKEEAEALKRAKLHSKFRDLYGGFDDIIKTLDVDIDVSI